MNNYFRFKQFTIYQDKCAQKVSEIACVFGAYIPVEHSKQILDIGAGTGLLSLMAAQRSNANIDSIEIDYDAYSQLQDNVSNSPFSSRITCIHEDIRVFNPEKKYDTIICNPPFFTKSLKSHSDAKNKAWHDDTLTINAVLYVSKKLLTDDGRLYMLLPESSKYNMEILNMCHDIGIAHSPSQHKPKFFIVAFQFDRIFYEANAPLIIKESNGTEYTDDMKLLLSPYYLYL